MSLAALAHSAPAAPPFNAMFITDMAPTPVVTAHRDAVDWIVAWSAVAAAVVAIVALCLAWYSITQSNRALIRERQLTFELGVLAQLAHACAHLFTGGEQNEALALTRLLPGELEGLRRDIEERAANGPAFGASERVLSGHWAEYEKAVSKRLGQPAPHPSETGKTGTE